MLFLWVGLDQTELMQVSGQHIPPLSPAAKFQSHSFSMRLLLSPRWGPVGNLFSGQGPRKTQQTSWHWGALKGKVRASGQ